MHIWLKFKTIFIVRWILINRLSRIEATKDELENPNVHQIELSTKLMGFEYHSLIVDIAKWIYDGKRFESEKLFISMNSYFNRSTVTWKYLKPLSWSHGIFHAHSTFIFQLDTLDTSCMTTFFHVPEFSQKAANEAIISSL